MRELDETDMEILSLLAKNSRRSFKNIGEQVGLSGPAVSNRVSRLEELGVINRFTVDIDRSQLHGGTQFRLIASVPDNAVDALAETMADRQETEHVIVTAEGTVIGQARLAHDRIREWARELSAEFPEIDYTIDLIDRTTWTPTIDGLTFAITCVECDNTVDEEGEIERIDGEIYQFCCQSCRDRFMQRRQRITENT